MIPRDQCKNRQLYRIRSRNLSFGVFHEENGGFFGIREKLGHTYVFEEYHHDNGPPYGTVTPLEELPEVLPEEILLRITFEGSYCFRCKVPCAYINFPDGEREKTYSDGHKMMVPGEWKHLEPTDCSDVCPTCKSNKALYGWLTQMELQYSHLQGPSNTNP